MARLPKRVLVERFEGSLRSAGWNVIALSSRSVHPARVRLFREGESFTARLYIWNVTHGGGANRPAHEYRIQITGVERFEPEPGGKTLILGWYEDLGVYAAFDYAHHAGRLGSSPSMQIGRAALESAARNGLAPYNRGNGEIAIAVRPDLLGFYLANKEDLHGTGAVRAEADALSRLGEDPDDVSQDELAALPAGPRQRTLVQTRRLLRDARFRARVLGAYRHRCSFCGVQLDLLDAAHVLPVGHPASTDEVNNGVALCALHHRAYDRALVTFDRSYRIVVGEAAIAKLETDDRAGGLEEFRSSLRDDLLLPRLAAHRPSRPLVVSANRLRGWPL